MCLCRRAQTLYGGRTVAASIDRNATRIGNAQGWELKAQSPTRISGSVVITIAAGLPDRRRCDADTLPKAILDLLVAHQVIEDDAKAVDVRTRRDENVPPGAHRHQRG
jgi:Holliday junction resolvase RusA-like endonuclease